MRSMTFDMIGMALMAVAVIATCGGMLMWGYVADTRGRPPRQDRRRRTPSVGAQEAPEAQPKGRADAAVPVGRR